MANHEIPAVPLRVRLRPVHKSCGAAGNCPTVYQTERDSVVVQGYAVASEEAGIDLPAGELLVEIPADLLIEAADRIRHAG
jgi:hypothetical protein